MPMDHLRNFYPYLKSPLLIFMFLAGCAVGPEYQAPEAPRTMEYTASPLPDRTAFSPVPAGEEQRFMPSQDIPEQWWSLFHLPELDGFMQESLRNNPTLEAAEATLRVARETMRAQYGVLYPNVDAKTSASREKISGASFGRPASTSPFNLYNASVNVSYALDIFGGARRELEALQAEVDYQRFQKEGAWLTLTSNIATLAVREASLRAQLDATREVYSLQGSQLVIVRQQFGAGGVSRIDVLTQESQLAQTAASFPVLEKELASARHQLAVLSGRTPGEVNVPEFYLERFTLPRDVPVTLPSVLVRQRPDIRASESLLHAANSRIGVATAALYPQINLTGSYGSESTTTGGLFSSGSVVWNLEAGLTQPIFRGGALTAQRRAAIASREAAFAVYRETVLNAFRDVADVLRALETDARVLKAQAEAEGAARNTLDLARRQFELGAVSYLYLLNAQNQYQLARINLVQARAARLADTAALYQALGGGWWNKKTDARR